MLYIAMNTPGETLVLAGPFPTIEVAADLGPVVLGEFYERLSDQARALLAIYEGTGVSSYDVIEMNERLDPPLNSLPQVAAALC